MDRLLDYDEDFIFVPSSPNVRAYSPAEDIEYFHQQLYAALKIPSSMLGYTVKPKTNAEALVERARALLLKYPDAIPDEAFKEFASTIEVQKMPEPPRAAYTFEGPVHSREYLLCDHGRLYEECARCLGDNCECSTCIAMEPWIDF